MKKSLSVSLVAALAASVVLAQPRKAADFTVSGYAGASPLADFPVLVRISPERISGFSYADCAADGRDVAFEDAQGNALDREIDTWDTAGESFVWVRLPTVEQGTTFTMTYGDLAVSAQPSCQTNGAVWGAADYVGVWHMNEANARDSSPRGNHGTAIGNAAPAAAGKIGSALSTPASTDYVTCGSGLPNSQIVDGFSVEGWACQPSYSGKQAFFGKNNFISIRSESATKITVTTPGKSDHNLTDLTLPAAGTWYHFALTFQRNTANACKLYINGAFAKSMAAGDINEKTIATEMYLAHNQWGKDQGFKGQLDEMRLSSSIRSADWIKASYDVQSNAAFLTSGAAYYLVSDNLLNILGDPAGIGSPTPAYGQLTGLSANETRTLSMAATAVPGEGTVTNYLKGWKLESIDVEDGTVAQIRSSADAGESIDRCVYVHAGCAQFTWLWHVRDAFGVGAPTLVAASPNALALSTDVAGIGYTAPSATLKLVYGFSPASLSFTNVVSASVTEIGAVPATLLRLAPGVNYYVKAVLETNDGCHDAVESAVVRFQTGDGVEFGGDPGLVQAKYSASWYTGAWDIPGASDATRVLGAWAAHCGNNVSGSMPWMSADGQTSFSTWGNNTTWGYAGYMYFLDKPYTFGGCMDDNVRVILNGATVLDQSGNTLKTAAWTPPDGAGWYPIEIRVGNGTGNYGPYGGFIGLGWNTTGYTTKDTTPNWNKFVDSGDGTLLRTKAALPIAAEEVLAGNALSSVSISFAASASARALCAAWGPVHGGDDPAGWYATNVVATIAAGATNAVWNVPADWGSDSNLVVRFYFDATPVEWSNSIYWRDASAPSVMDVALDGDGGDTLVVSGNLASFPGDTCALNVYVGTTAGEPEYAWTGLAGSVRAATGAFSLTLFEADAAAARYLTPGETYFVTVEAVSGGQVVRTAPQKVTMKAEPEFAVPSSSVARRTVTFNGRLTDTGMSGAATVTLYAGAESDAEDDLVAIEPSATITSTDPFTFTHTFPAFETTYKWQLRAVAVSAGETSTLTTRTAVATCKTLDTTTYTWRSAISSGNWDDAANWSNDKVDDCLGYPQSTAASAAFPANVRATVFFRRALSVANINLSNSGLEITFAQGGASTNATKLTASALNFNGVNGSITLDGVAISTTGNVTIGARRALRLVNGANLYTANLIAEAGGNEISLSGGSWLSSSQLQFGGATILIDDSTFWTRSHDYVGRTLTGGRVVFSGARPLWWHNNADGYFCSTLANANVQLDFLVPAGGFPTAPLQAISTEKYILGNNGNSAGFSAYTVNVLDESPALFADGTITSPLISWPNKGINTNLVLRGHLPDIGGGTSASFAWDEETTNPKALSVTVTGAAHNAQLQVSGAPEAIEQSGFYPLYGFHSLSSNATVNCTAPSGLFQISETKRATCTGWKLYSVNPATQTRTLEDSGDGTTCTVTGDGGWLALEWQWKVEYLVTATAGAGGSAEPASQWCELGSWTLVTAVPDASHGFYKWTSGVPAGARATQQTLGFIVDGPATLSASFGNVWYVSPNGDGSAPNAGFATGYTTVAAGLAAAQAGDTVRVKAAQYRLDDAVNLAKAVRIEGEDRDSTILYKSGTTIVSYRLVTFNHADAVLSGVTISNGYANITAGGVYFDANGGTLENCRVQQCRDNKGSSGPAIYVNSDNGLITRCILEDNFGDNFSYPHGTGVYLAKGVIENSLVRRNYTTRGNNDGAGINLGGTSVARNCTVVRNTSSRYGGGIACGTTATAVNCAIYDNAAANDTSAGKPDWYGPPDRFVNCASPVAANGTCLGESGGFIDPASGDYRLLAGSALRNAGAAVSGISAFDLAGNPRVSGGAIDIGCYEFDESAASVGLSVTPENLFAGGTAVFTPALVGVADNAPRTWTITDEHGVATVLSASCESGVALSNPGLYTVHLDVAVPGGQTLSAERAAYLYVAPQTIYVDAASANPQSPYATPATAATDINAAASYANRIDGSDILVADGTYSLTGELHFARPVTLRSANGPEKAILKRFGAQESGDRFRILYLDHVSAKATGFTLTGGSISAGSGGGCYIGPNGGELTDCIVSNNYVSTYDASGGGIYMNSSYAHVDRCFITGNKNKQVGAYCHGGGVKVSAGLLENCLVTDNWTYHRGGGVWIGGTAKMYNCTVYGNTAANQTGGGIHADGTTCRIRNCAAYGNTAPNDTAEGAPDMSANGASVCVNCAFPKAVGSLAAIPDPAFTDPAHGDFTVQSSSALRNGGTALADLGALDLAGDARVQGAAPDIGCYEYDESQRAISFTASPVVAFAGDAVAFTPTIEGFGSGATHSWTLTDGDGHETTFAAAAEAAYAIATDGLYTVTLTVTDSGETFTSVREDYLRVVKRKYVVATVEELYAAVDAASYIDGVEIEVADGVYDLTGTIEITTATTFHSLNGPTNAVLRRTFGRDRAPLFRILYINDPDAKVSGFTITGGSTDVAHGGGVLIGTRGGELSQSIVSNNWVKTYDSSGGGIHMNSSNAHVDRCVITCNTNAHTSSSYCYGGGVRVSGGLLENSLITHNWTDHRGGGVYISGTGKMYNCTVYGNKANKQTGGGIHADGSTCSIRNTASYGNTADYDTAPGAPDINSVASGVCVNCAFPKAVDTLEAIPDPLFTDAEGGDFTLQTGSPLIDAGAAVADLGPLDLAGNDRAYGETTPDIGCYEYQPGAVGLNFTVSPAAGFAGGTYTFTPTIEGVDGEVAKSWTITDQAGATTTLPATCEAGIVLDSYGTYDVTLTVSAGGQTYSLTREALFKVAPRDLYVDAASATPQAPYATRATAATNVIAAVAEAIDGSTVHVAPGDYEQPATIVLDADIAVVSDAGAAATTLRRAFGTANPQFGIVYMNAPGALVKGFTITGGRDANYGGVRIQSRGGTLEACIVEDNASTGSYGNYPGGVLASSANARVRRCIIRNNTMAATTAHFGAGASISSGRIENCLITGNGPASARANCGGGLYLNGTAWNCTIVSNFSNRVTGGAMLGNDGRAVNCAILGNAVSVEVENADWNASMRDYLTYCASSVRAGEGYLVMTFDEACFRNPTAGDYRPRNRSPLVNAGSDLSYGATDIDLAGNQRIYEKGVNRHAACDIGCYEAAFNPGGGTMIILR